VADQLSTDEREKMIEDLQVMQNDVMEEISDLASDGSEPQEVMDHLEARVARVGKLIEELKGKSGEAEIIEQVAEDLFRTITELDNEVIEETVEDYLAARGIGMPAVRDWDSDESVTQEYLRYEAAQRRIYRRAWLVTAKKLIDAYAETEN
jgi:hypothetical protein